MGKISSFADCPSSDAVNGGWSKSDFQGWNLRFHSCCEARGRLCGQRTAHRVITVAPRLTTDRTDNVVSSMAKRRAPIQSKTFCDSSCLVISLKSLSRSRKSSLSPSSAFFSISLAV